jgi:hypothetical protein
MLIGTSVRSPRNTIEVSVRSAAGAQRLYRRLWDGALFTAGTPGQAYTLRVRNLTPGRIEVITTVDGRNTLTDKSGHHHASGGFVIPPPAAGSPGFYDFAGFRLDDGTVREFKFGSPDRTELTVAAQATGATANIGVFGFAAYREQTCQSWTPDGFAAATNGTLQVAAAAAPGGAAGGGDFAPPARSIGTEMGALREDHVQRVNFTRTGDPDILVIGYDTADALLAMGAMGPPEPDPFPGAATGYEKYAPAEEMR